MDIYPMLSQMVELERADRERELARAARLQEARAGAAGEGAVRRRLATALLALAARLDPSPLAADVRVTTATAIE